MHSIRSTVLLPVLAIVALCVPATASAEVAHVVQPGETLWSIAAANNLATSALARYNGVSEDSNVVLGATIRVPTEQEALATLNGSAPAGTSAAQSATAQATPQAPPAEGAYTVRVGDTLSGLAAQSGVSTAQMAAMNGLDPDAFLLAGTVIKLPTGAPAPARAGEPAPATKIVPAASPDPTPVRLSASQVGSIASQAGVPPSLAAAIAWQESGFNNGMVSSANARGVMQVMPGTWQYVQDNLATRQLDPASATDNVHAGSLYLARLLRDAGGDERLAVAGYYQGLASVRRIGMLPETKRYVDNVMALQSRFGG